MFQWNHGIGDSFAEVSAGVCFITKTSIRVTQSMKHEREVIENLPHANRPSTSDNENKVEKIKETVLEKHCGGFREIAADLNISYGSTQHVFVIVSDS